MVHYLRSEKWRIDFKKPLYCGNIEYEVHQSEIERLFGKYGRVERVDMKSGYAFVYMEDERDAEDAIRALDKTEFSNGSFNYISHRA